MSNFKPFLVAFTLAAVLVTAPVHLFAQTPNDVMNPSNDDGSNAQGYAREPLPEFIPGVIRTVDRINTVAPTDFAGLEPLAHEFDNTQARAMLTFDAVLDPGRLAAPSDPNNLEFFRRANFDDLTPGVQTIIRNYLIAQQQVQLAIDFLESRREEILAGDNDQFNDVFGNIGLRRRHAILAPRPLSGVVDVNVNTAGGNFELEADDPFPAFSSQLRAGQLIWVGTNPASQNDQGRVFRVVRVDADDDGDNQVIITDTSGTGNTQALTSGQNVYRVVGFTNTARPERFDVVLETFEAIRQALAGYNVGAAAGSTTGGMQTLINLADPNSRAELIQHNVQFQRGYQAIGPVGGSQSSGNPYVPVFTRGIGRYASLDGFTGGRNETDPALAAQLELFGADRLFRQAGLSTSDSHTNLDRVEDIRDGLAFDRGVPPTNQSNRRPVFNRGMALPLLWTEDNQLPETFNSRTPTGTDEDRAFFRDRQTIFGRLNFGNTQGNIDDPFEMFIGRAFLEETIHHERSPGDFLGSIPIINNPLAVGLRTHRESAGAVPVCAGQTANTTNPRTDCTEVGDMPETGNGEADSVSRSTTFRRWQMIIEAFAEWQSAETESGTFANRTAFVGLLNIVGGGADPGLRVKDAGSFARFAALIGSTRSDTSGIDRTRIEPRNRRASAGFFPIVLFR